MNEYRKSKKFNEMSKAPLDCILSFAKKIQQSTIYIHTLLQVIVCFIAYGYTRKRSRFNICEFGPFELAPKNKWLVNQCDTILKLHIYEVLTINVIFIRHLLFMQMLYAFVALSYSKPVHRITFFKVLRLILLKTSWVVETVFS